jgi:3-dehydroquinate synthase
VAGFYIEAVQRNLEKSGFEVVPLIVKPGEHSKTLTVADSLFEKMITARLDRKCTVISLGGGVVGDLAGFLAATYLRGVAFAQIPTTLLAQTDSSVGGKVGVNHRLGKNLIGAFYQPKFVLIDPNVLRTLPKREMWAGLAEVVKYTLIYDAAFFTQLEKQLERVAGLKDLAVAGEVIQRCCEIKAAVVEEDEKEIGLRRILNFGHTIGHALEALTNYDFFRHGEAVTLGMLGMTWLSAELGLLKPAEKAQALALVKRLAVPLPLPQLDSKAVVAKMYSDKKVAGGVLNVVLLDRIGRAVIQGGVCDEILQQAVEFVYSCYSEKGK